MAGEFSAIKIGFAQEREMKRAVATANASPYDVFWIGCFEATADVERAIHRRFAGAHIKGEWFHPTEELMSYILGTFPDYSEVRAFSRESEESLLKKVRSAIGESPYILGVFQDHLGAAGGDIIHLTMWLFHNQPMTKSLLMPVKEALASFSQTKYLQASA
jgi:hypothetical protein